MEGNFRLEAPPPHLPPPASNTDRCRELTRLNLDASFVIAESCKDILHPSANSAPDECIAWTDEKHNIYLHQLEIAFVKQHYQSKLLLAQAAKRKSQRDLNLFRKELRSNASDQFTALKTGCLQKIDSVMDNPLSGSISADSQTSLKSNQSHNFKYMGKHCHCPWASAATPELLKLCSTMEHGERTISLGLARSHKLSPCKQLHRDLFGLTREGMGQNFLDDDNQRTSAFESRPKRSKTAPANSSSQDQIAPFDGMFSS